MTERFSVIIPAHNEGSVIGRCLNALLDGVDDRERPEVIVVCNGCTDDTADIARRSGPDIIVIEVAEGSKPLALNTGNAAASMSPRFFVDADVVVSYRSLAAVASVLLSGQADVAAPRMLIQTEHCSRAVQRYYRTWLSQPYAQQEMVGSGVYGLSMAGLDRIGTIPPIIADDAFVRSRFAVDRRRSVAQDDDGRSVAFTMFPPDNLHDLIRIESRRRAGDAQLRELYPTAHTQRTTSVRSLASAHISSRDKATYIFVKSAGRILQKINALKGRSNVWLRDDSSRK